MRVSCGSTVSKVLVVALCLGAAGCGGGVTFDEPPEQAPVERQSDTQSSQPLPEVNPPSPATVVETDQPATVARHPDARDYYRPLSDYDKENIRYIINTLSHNSTFALISYKSSLERVGERTSDIHPLKYLGFMFSDPKLKHQIKHIGRTPWKRFVRDFGNSLTKAAERDNITDDMVADFAQRVGMEQGKVQPVIAGQQWSQLMKSLVDHVG